VFWEIKKMKINNTDRLFLILTGAGGFILVISATQHLLAAIILGIPSGMFGGCVVCILKHYLKSQSISKEER